MTRFYIRGVVILFISLIVSGVILEASKKSGNDEGGGAIFLVLFVLWLTAFFLVRPLFKKLRQQEETIARIADGDLNARVPEQSKDAIGRLGSRINLMADRIQGLLENQRELVQAVSHEMRTPTARIGFSLEMLADAKSDEERTRRIASMEEDLNEMDSLLDELLDYLRFDEEAQRMDLSVNQLPILLEHLKAKVTEFRKDVVIELRGEPGAATVVASNKLLPRVIENLMMNAVRHASSKVEVFCHPSDTGLAIEVHDDGPGVPTEDRERIFEPFIRLDTSRQRGSGGTGLGLAIARRAVERHKGSLSVGESPLGGAVFTIALPTAAPPA